MGFGNGTRTYHNDGARRYRDGARVQKTFDNAQCAHVWRQGVQDFGRSGNGNLYFHDARLYSYGRHYVVAILTPDGAGIINADKSSVSTTGHIGDARRAFGYAGYISAPDLTTLCERTPFGPWCDYHTRMAGGEQVDSGNLESLKRGARVAVLEYVAKHAHTLEEERAGIRLLHLVGVADAAERFPRMLAASKKKQDADKAATERRRRDHYLRLAARVAGFTAEERAAWLGEQLPSRVTSSENGIGHTRVELHRARGYAKAAKRTKQAAAVSAIIRDIDSALKKKRKGLERWQERRGIHNALEQFRFGFERCASGVGFDSSWRAESFVQAVCYVALHVKTLRPENRASLEIFAAQLRTGWNAWRDAEAAEAEERERQRAAERFAKQAEARAAWLRGDSVMPHLLHGMTDETGGALLRAVNVTRDESGAIVGGTLETSQRANVPLPHAVRAFRFLKRCKESGRDWHKNGHAIRVGHFQIDSIDSAGNFRAGCHRINWPEVERLARELGVFEVQSDDSALEPSRIAG